MERHGLEAYYECVDRPTLVRTPDDVDAIIDWFLSGVFRYTLVQLFSLDRDKLPSGFPDHEFMAGVDPDRNVGVLAFAADGDWLSNGPSDDYSVVRYNFMGHDRAYPHSAEISIDQVRKAIKEFLVSGGQRPRCVDWVAGDADELIVEYD